MYEITMRSPNLYECFGRYQNGHDTWYEETLEKAIASMKLFAEQANHNKNLRTEDIRFSQIVEVTELRRVEWEPPINAPQSSSGKG